MVHRNQEHSFNRLTEDHRSDYACWTLLVERGEIPDKIRLIKIDVEGFEMEVLRGMRKTLETVQPILIVEINSVMLAYQESSPAELFLFLTSLGYRIFTTHLSPLSHLATQETIDVLCLPR